MIDKDFKFTMKFIGEMVALRKSLGIEKPTEYRPKKHKTANSKFTGFEENIVTTLDEQLELLDLSETGQPLLDKNGNCRFVYIPDNAISTGENQSYRKVHITHCNTLQGNQNSNSKFSSTTKSDGIFPVHLKNDEIKYVKLEVCKNCLKEMRNKNLLKYNQYGAPEDFNFMQFAEDFKNKYPVEFYSYGDKFDKYDYPKNWGKISFDYRKSVHWICENCGKSYSDNVSNLHVHHINSIRSDCKQSNLKALCRDCHEKEHPHLKRIRQ